MASPIFPGVGTQSRIAQVQQAGSDINLRQEALNRSSGQALLGTALQGTLGLGDLLNQAVQEALNRQQRGTEAGAERAAAIARITATGEQARETGVAAAGLGTAEAQRIEGLTQTELERQEARGEPGGADFIERIRREVIAGGQAKDLADIQAQTQRETGAFAAEQSRQEFLPEELKQRGLAAAEEARIAQEFSRDPITALEDMLTGMIETVEIRARQGQGIRAQAEFEARLPGLIKLYEFFLEGDPTGSQRAKTLEVFRRQKIQRDADSAAAATGDQANRLETPSERAARLRLRGIAPPGNAPPGLQPVGNLLLGASASR